MGDPAKKRKQYTNPRKQWDRQLLDREKKLVDVYGLKTKRELRRSETWLREKRKQARDLLILPLEKRKQREDEIMSGLKKIGLAKDGTTIDDVLGLKIEELLERRLQTYVFRKGLATTTSQSRQFITHGHIAINGKRVTAPSYIVPVDEAGNIGWYKGAIKIAVEKKEDVKKAFEESAPKDEIAGEAVEKVEGEAK